MESGTAGKDGGQDEEVDATRGVGQETDAGRSDKIGTSPS